MLKNSKFISIQFLDYTKNNTSLFKKNDLNFI